MTTADQLGDINGDGIEERGNVVLVRQPAARVFADPTSSSSAYIDQLLEDKYTYNSFGHRRAHIDSSGRVTQYHYHSEQDPDGDGAVTSQALDSTIGPEGGGFLKGEVTPEGVISERRYDALCRIIESTHYRGTTPITSSTVYNQAGEIVEEVDALGSRTRYEYDWNGNMTSRKIEHRVPGLDSSGNLTGQMVDGPSGPWLEEYFTYDIAGNLVSEDLPVEAQIRAVTLHRYDKLGNRVLTFSPLWQSNPHLYTSKVFDERNFEWSRTRGGLTSDFQGLFADGDIPERAGLTSSPHVSTLYRHYDGSGNLIKQVDGEGNETQQSFDSFGRLWKATDPLGNRQESDYDSSGQIVESWVYEDDGTLLSHSRLDYDEIGRLYQSHSELFLVDSSGIPLTNGVLSPGDAYVTKRTQYDSVNNAVLTIDDDGRVTTSEYDGDGRLTSSRDPRGNTVRYTYSGSGNVHRVEQDQVDDAGAVVNTTRTWQFYDAVGRLTATLDHAGHVSRTAYDSRGLAVQQTNAQGTPDVAPSTLDLYGEHLDLVGLPSINSTGTPTVFTYDDRGFVTATTTHLSTLGPSTDGLIQVSTSYDLNGRTVSRTDDSGNTTTYVYDSLNRIRHTNYPDPTSSHTAYDRRDLVTWVKTQNGDEITHSYDAAGRVTTRTVLYSDQTAAVESFQYDGLGRLTLAVNNAASVGRYYDSLGRLVRETIDGDITEMSYDGSGNLVYLKYPGGRVIQRAYDDRGLLTSITDPGAPGWGISLAYEGGRTSNIAYADGATSSWAYDSLGRPVDLLVRDSASSLVEHRGSEWDRNSNRTARTDLQRGRRFEYDYDSINRLVESRYLESNVVQSTVSYDLDDEGNRVSVGGGPASGSYLMSPAATYASVHAYSSTPGWTSLTYDLNGNTETRFGSALTEAFDYDYRNLMQSYQRGAVTAAIYEYDALGRRVRRTVTGQSPIVYRYIGAQLCEERNTVSGEFATFVIADNLDELLSVRRSSIDWNYYTDDQGHVLAIAAEGSSSPEQYEYDDYGKVYWAGDLATLTQSPASGNLHHFAGRPIDWETGFYYVRARYLDPSVGRFTTRDPLGSWADPLSLGNGYTYAGNNPWTYTDPSGTKAQKKKVRLTRKQKRALKRLKRKLKRAHKAWKRYQKKVAKEIRKAARRGREPDFTNAENQLSATMPPGLAEAIVSATSIQGKPPTDLTGADWGSRDLTIGGASGGGDALTPGQQEGMETRAVFEAMGWSLDDAMNRQSGQGDAQTGGGGIDLETAQFALDVFGAFEIPGFLTAADLASAGISLYKGDLAGAGISFIGALPLIGLLGTVMRFGDDAAHAAKGALRIADSPFGKKAAKHAASFGLDPSSAQHRAVFRGMIEGIASSPDQVVTGAFRGQGVVDFLIKGNDVVVRKGGDFVTILKGGINNPSVMKALKQ